MPNVKMLLKPALKMTQAQWKRLLEKVVLKEEQAGVRAFLPAEEATGEAVGRLFEHEPMTSKVYGRLYEPGASPELGRRPIDLPWVDAVKEYISGGGRLSAETKRIPPVKELVPPQGVVPGRGLSREEVLQKAGGEYQMKYWRPVKTTGENIRPAVTEAEREQRLLKLREERKKQKVLQEAQGSIQKVTGKTGKPSEELVVRALTLDQMWKFIGGGRSYTGRRWKVFKENAPGRYKVSDTKDYFYRVGLRWIEDPEKTRKRFPKEVKSLEEIWREFNNAHSES